LNYRRFRKRAENYYKRVRNAKSIPEILNFSKNHSENPLKEMFLEVYSKLHEQVELNPQDTPIIRSAENLERTLQRVMRGQIMHLESGLAFLATTASATPFISLSK
jgi:biopolymer transport protein ExbB/TolQ